MATLLSSNQVIRSLYDDIAGRLKVDAVVSGTTSNAVSVFGEIQNVDDNLPHAILSHSVDSIINKLKCVNVSGSNIATFWITVNSNTVDKKRTFWGNFNQDFDFLDGLKLQEGDVIEIWVQHSRPYAGDFNARLHLTG